jgi:hypothetical protein
MKCVFLINFSRYRDVFAFVFSVPAKQCFLVSLSQIRNERTLEGRANRLVVVSNTKQLIDADIAAIGRNIEVGPGSVSCVYATVVAVDVLRYEPDRTICKAKMRTPCMVAAE